MIRTQRNSLPLLCMNYKVPEYSDYYFRDDFDDAIRDPLWTDEPNNGTITESGGVLTLAILDTDHGDFWCGTKDAPICTIDSTVENLVVTTKLNSYIVNNKTRVGLYITDVVSGNNGLSFCRGKNVATPSDGLGVNDMCVGELDYVDETTLPIWLRIRALGSGVGSTMYFDYSTDGINWTNLYIHSDETWSKVGLVAKNWTEWNAIAAPFEFFLLETPTEQECLAPIDTRAPTKFYHGRIKQMSTLKRAVDDKTGLFQVADMSITLANEDKHYSQKMADRILKNQLATLYHALTDEPEASKIEIIKLIVDDHSMKGPDFIVNFKDITQKYFTKKIPENLCTKDEFPNIHPDYEGWCMPEILGNASLLGSYEYEGAVQAVYVDTDGAPYICLASAGLITIPTDEVWVDGAQQIEGAGDDYTVVLAGGRTYIHFNAGSNPGDAVVSFNAHGYSVPAWDSVPGGYIQNLAYIIEYFLRFIMEFPADQVNSASFDTLASHYEDMGVDQNCFLILQDRVDAMEILRQLLFTGGAKGFMAMDGRFNVKRKDICNWEIDSNEYHIFEQIELFGSAHRKWNLTSAINTVNAQYGLIPWQNLYRGATSDYRDNRYERDMEDDIRRERPIERPGGRR